MANMHLVTGFANAEHIKSADQGSFNASMFGDGEYVLERGNRFALTTISNNVVRVKDGDILMQGRYIRLDGGTYIDLEFDNGQQGYLRNDLIVVRYTKDPETGIEEANLAVLKGTPSTAVASDPTLTKGDIINDHVLVNEMPLYRIPFSGLNIQEPECLFEIFERVIVGPTGPQGPVGPIGPQGPEGPAGSDADLKKYFGIPNYYNPTQILILANEGSSERRVVGISSLAGITDRNSGTRFDVTIPAHSCATVYVDYGEFALLHTSRDVYHSESISYDRLIKDGSVSIHVYKIDTCGVLLVQSTYKECLTGDTLVTMADGTEKRLDEICVGDEVLSMDWDTKSLFPNKVIFTDKDEGKSHVRYDKWTFSDGTVVKTVHRHEFFNAEAKCMKYMDEWQTGEHAYRKDGEKVALSAHETVEETVRHYKITLENGTNYFANGLLNGDRYCPKGIEL